MDEKLPLRGQKSICGTIGRRNGQPCKNPPMANGRCRMHGGSSTGPKDKEKHSQSLLGNKNNPVKTGEFETIWGDVLDDEEIEFLQKRKEQTILAIINEELDIITVRERRMLQRIEKLKNAGDFTIVSIETETGYGQKKYKRTNIRKEQQSGTLGQIQSIEDALTRVQDKKAKLIELKYNIEKGDGPKDMSGIEKFLGALNGAAKQAWGNEKAPVSKGANDDESEG